MEIQVNEYQTTITDELLQQYPEEVREQFMDFITNIEFVRNLISPNRPRAKDLPRDEKGRIIVNLENPHIIEDADYFRQPALHFMKYGCYTFLKPNSNPHSEYRKHWDEEVRRIREGYVRESDGEWVTGYCYWFLNYCPMLVNLIEKGRKKAIRTESMPFFFEGIYWRFHYLYRAREEGKHAIELARRGAHPHFQKVFTPEGWKEWKDIHIGSKLYATDGSITTVTDIPYDDIAPYYKITLRDGRVVFASDDHLWKVIQHNHAGEQLYNTEELLSYYKKVRQISDRIPSGIEYTCGIPSNQGINLQYNKTKVDPYTFGLLLGDGCFRHQSCYYTCSDEDFQEIKNYIPYKYTKWKYKCSYRLHIDNWKSILEEYKLYNLKSEDKFIPNEFLINSKEVRLELLRGLMDSDGYNHKSTPELCTTSKKLRDDILFLARSLGYNCQYVIKKAGYKNKGIYKECLPVYIITIYGGKEVFKLKRKQDKISYNSKRSLSRKIKTIITDIQFMGYYNCKCVTVDSKDSCYLIGDFITTHNCAKSYSLAAIMSHNLLLGESEESKRRITTVLTAYEKEYLKDDKDGTLSKFKPEINFQWDNTPFPRLTTKNSPNEMSWVMGYKDEYGIEKGSLNMVLGVSAKDNPDKLRGKRGWILFEEMGLFKGLLALYDTTRKSVEDGDYTFALMYLVGTASEDESDFSSAKTLLYSPEGYNILSIKNVFDKPSQGKPTFGFFFPAYINRLGCYNKDGVSDVVKALLQILMARYKAKYSTDPKSVLRVIAEDPITPAEAIIKVKSAYFPVAALNERLLQLDSNPNSFDDVYIGTLVQVDDKVEFRITGDTPIRQYGVSNDTEGALEIFQMPKRKLDGKVYENRYIIGHDPVDNDQADSNSLSSTFVFDLYTDTIVAEFTGRKPFADDNFEMVRLLCLFYNAKCMYEAHPYSQLVYTPDGPKQWEDIQIGDSLFSPTKGIVKVIDIPVDEEMDIYKITLSDGRVIEASDSHIWTVYEGTSRTQTNITTLQMLNRGMRTACNQHKFFIPEHQGVEYPVRPLLIDPYTMGLILSEGSIRGTHCTKNCIQVSSNEEDMLFYQNNIPYQVKHIGSKGYSWHLYIPGCKNIMMNYNLYGTDSYTKFIPSDYLYSHRVQRMELLKGIMDGDGCARTKGASILITCSERLANDVLSLVRSLGIKGWLQTSRNGVYRVAIASQYKVFKLPRKVVDQYVYRPYIKGSKASAILNKTAIEKIEFSHREMGKCVTVDSKDGLYLIGDYVVTHNCNKKGMFPYFKTMNCTHLLAETPEYLRDMEYIKYNNFGSNRYGITATAAINSYANSLIRDWLLKPVTVVVNDENGVPMETTQLMLSTIKSRALLDELIQFQPELNVDRIRALGMVMLYRQEKIVLYQNNLNEQAQEKIESTYLGKDDFFTRNYDNRIQLLKNKQTAYSPRITQGNQ